MRIIQEFSNLSDFSKENDLEKPPSFFVKRAVDAARVLAYNPVIRTKLQLQDRTGLNANTE